MKKQQRIHQSADFVSFKSSKGKIRKRKNKVLSSSGSVAVRQGVKRFYLKAENFGFRGLKGHSHDKMYVPYESCYTVYFVKNKYEPKEEIGRGSFGKVVLARYWGNTDAPKLVAVKIVPKCPCSEREVKLMKKFRHPNLSALLDKFESVSHFYIVQQFCSHGNMSEYLEQQSEMLSDDQAKQFARGISNGLEYMHSEGYAHQDVKLENIIVQSSGQHGVKLCDFGTAVKLNPNSGYIVDVCGSRIYLAPKVFKQKAVMATKLDVWAYGLVIYGIFFEKLPDYTTSAKMDETIRAIEKLELPKNDRSSTANSYLKRALTINPSERASMADLLNDEWVQLDSDEDI